MKIEEVRAVIGLYRCAIYGKSDPTESIYKLMKLAARVRRLTKGRNGKQMSDRQERAYDRAMDEADKLAEQIGCMSSMSIPLKGKGQSTISILAPNGDQVVL